MNDGMNKFRELLLTDEAFQKKMKAALKNYTGEKTEEAVFNNVLIPLANEYGITASFEEFKTYLKQFTDSGEPMSKDELRQIAGGGKSFAGGIGLVVCEKAGLGFGGNSNTQGGTGCFVIGYGNETSACMGLGTAEITEEGQKEHDLV